MAKLIQEFKEFAVKGNVVDMAVGIIIGAAFGTIVKSLVSDVIMPPIGMLMGGVDFTDFFITLSGGSHDSLAAAKKAGAVTLNYGVFATRPDKRCCWRKSAPPWSNRRAAANNKTAGQEPGGRHLAGYVRVSQRRCTYAR
jgi:hypothetical protein